MPDSICGLTAATRAILPPAGSTASIPSSSWRSTCTTALPLAATRRRLGSSWRPSVPDPRTILIQPWDATQMKEIEKGIAKSDLGLSPSNDGKVIRLTMPTLTEERRKQLAKTVGKLAEEARVAIRNVRRDANERLKALAKEKKVSQDEERRGHDQIQKGTDRFIGKVDELTKKKEQEVLAI